MDDVVVQDYVDVFNGTALTSGVISPPQEFASVDYSKRPERVQRRFKLSKEVLDESWNVNRQDSRYC